MIMKKIQVDKLEDIISEIDYKISNLNKQTGRYEECITNIEGKIFEKQTELQEKKTLYNTVNPYVALKEKSVSLENYTVNCKKVLELLLERMENILNHSLLEHLMMFQE